MLLSKPSHPTPLSALGSDVAGVCDCYTLMVYQI